MATARERLAEWLRDAHATEGQAETMLKGAAGHMDDYPMFKRRLEEQAQIAARHAGELERCLSGMGESTSTLKNFAGQVTAVGQTISGLLVGDEVMKAALATDTFAKMEATSYRILAAAAEAAGEPQVRSMCENLLADEVEFMDWLDQQLPALTAQYLAREAAGATAKH